MNPFFNTIERLSEVGWNKGSSIGPHGEECIAQAACGLTFNSRMARILDEVVKEQYPDRLSSQTSIIDAAKFNDHPDTTLSDVIAVLEKAAVRYDEEI